MKVTVTEDWVRLDRLAKAVYGSERGGTVEALLNANPGLAALAAAQSGFLPRGTTVTVPTLPPTASDPALTRPWN